MTQDIQEKHELSPTVESPPKGTVEETKNQEVKTEEPAVKTSTEKEVPTAKPEDEQKEKPVKKKVAFFEKFMGLFRKKSSSVDKSQSEDSPSAGLKKKKSDKRPSNKTKSEVADSKCKCDHTNKDGGKKTASVASSEIKEKGAKSDATSPAQPTIVSPIGDDGLFDKKEIIIKDQSSSNEEGKSTSHQDNQSKGIASIGTADDSVMHTIPISNSTAGDELLSQDSKINLLKDNLSDVKINSIENTLPPSSIPEALDKSNSTAVVDEKKSQHSLSSSSSQPNKIQSTVHDASSNVEETKPQEETKIEDPLKLKI